MRRIPLLAVVWLFALFVRAERIELLHDDARCVIETRGARVVSYSVAGRELLWMPKASLDDDPVWRHGGIPVAWPWFGRIGRGLAGTALPDVCVCSGLVVDFVNYRC